MNEQAKGHGHVTPNPNGDKARCGGPKICKVCMAELAILKAQPVGAALEAGRVPFEAWYVTDCLNEAQIVITQEEVSKLRGKHGDYRERAALHGKWVGWQAGRAQLAAPAGVPAEWAKLDPAFVVMFLRQSSAFDADLIGEMLNYAISAAAPSPAPASDVVQVPRPMLEDLRDCANECYNHARMRGTSGLDNYELLTEQADALLNGGRV